MVTGFSHSGRSEAETRNRVASALQVGAHRFRVRLRLPGMMGCGEVAIIAARYEALSDGRAAFPKGRTAALSCCRSGDPCPVPHAHTLGACHKRGMTHGPARDVVADVPTCGGLHHHASRSSVPDRRDMSVGRGRRRGSILRHLYGRRDGLHGHWHTWRGRIAESGRDARDLTPLLRADWPHEQGGRGQHRDNQGRGIHRGILAAMSVARHRTARCRSRRAGQFPYHVQGAEFSALLHEVCQAEAAPRSRQAPRIQCVRMSTSRTNNVRRTDTRGPSGAPLRTGHAEPRLDPHKRGRRPIPVCDLTGERYANGRAFMIGCAHTRPVHRRGASVHLRPGCGPPPFRVPGL